MKKSSPTIVYKILRERDGALWSWSPPIGCEQRYSTTRINRPKITNSFLFAFRTLEAAREFDRWLSNKVIYKCEATGITRTITRRLQVGQYRAAARRFWKTRRWSNFDTIEIAPDAVLVKTLRLVEKVALSQELD